LRPASLLRAALAFACAAVLALPTLAQDSEGEGAAASAASARAEPLPAGETVAISVPHAGVFGGTLTMTAQVFRPAGDGPFPVVVFSHGRAPGGV
jgi:predicted dienelactone hydrolase